jgi:hypothetical protein
MAMAIRNAQRKSQTQVPAGKLPIHIAGIQSFKALMPQLIGNQSPKLFRKALKLFLKPVAGLLKNDSLVNVERQKALINALPKQSEGDRFKAFEIIIANEELLGEDLYNNFYRAIQNSTQKSGAEQIADLFSQSAVAQPASSQPLQYQQHRAAAGQVPNVYSAGLQSQQNALLVAQDSRVIDLDSVYFPVVPTTEPGSAEYEGKVRKLAILIVNAEGYERELKDREVGIDRKNIRPVFARPGEPNPYPAKLNEIIQEIMNDYTNKPLIDKLIVLQNKKNQELLAKLSS